MSDDDKEPQLPVPYTVADIQAIAEALGLAVGHLLSAVEEMNGGKEKLVVVESAYLHLDYLRNTLLPKVKAAAENAHIDATREKEAKQNNVQSEKTKNALRHHAARMKAWNAKQKQVATGHAEKKAKK